MEWLNIVFLHLGWVWTWSFLCGQVIFIHRWSLFRGYSYSISWWEETEMVFVDRQSLFTDGLYSDVIYIAFLDGWKLKWSLWTDSLYSQVIFNTGYNVCTILYIMMVMKKHKITAFSKRIELASHSELNHCTNDHTEQENNNKKNNNRNSNWCLPLALVLLASPFLEPAVVEKLNMAIRSDSETRNHSPVVVPDSANS